MLAVSYVADTARIAELLEPFGAEVSPMWKFTQDIDADFETVFLDACARHKWNPTAMLSCWNSESNVEHFAMNKGGFATGIFQLMPDTARGLGWMARDSRWKEIDALRDRLEREKATLTQEQRHAVYLQIADRQLGLMRPFTQLTATEQIPWAEKFYGGVGPLETAEACYVKTFLPALLSHAGEPEFVLCGKDGPYADAYAGNHVAFDPEGKGYILVNDLSKRIARAATGARWQELADRIRVAQQGRDTDREFVVTDPPVGPDLLCPRGQQEALNRLGYECAVDGHWGPQSAAACRSFQTDRDMAVDGVCGPLTQAALAIALQTAG